MVQPQYHALLKELETDEEIDREVKEAVGQEGTQGLESIYGQSIQNFEVGVILKGKVLEVTSDVVLVDVGYKSEGVIGVSEFDDPKELDVGEEIEVLLEAVEDDSGMVVLSKRKADRIRGWERVISEYKEGDKISGRVLRKIKGGLLVDIGVPVFLPASQVNIRRTGDIGELIGQEIEAKIIKIDVSRRNIVISRRKLIEEERDRMKKKLLEEIQVNQVRQGVVKNITDFGAFVDLGGIDGLLHITDMSWGRISHPSEMVKLDERIEVVILDFDREREKISLGLKQRSESPWVQVEQKYPVGSKHRGEVVNLMSYGAFVKLEDGIEGLVHISEMSWTRRINHPSEVVQIGDEVEVVILAIHRDKQEISLGMKQAEANPWETVEQRYTAGARVSGRVRNLANYGAFVELEEGIDGLLHVSDISWTKKVTHPSEILKKGQEVEAVILSVDKERKRIALGMKQLEDDPWDRHIPESYHVGQVVTGKVTKITNFGVFVELQTGLEGLLHISELADHKVENPEEMVQVGTGIDVKVIKVDPKDRKIGLSLRRVGRVEAGGEAAARPEREATAGEAKRREADVEAEEPASVADLESPAAAEPARGKGEPEPPTGPASPDEE
ncbi:MAG: 30S ribosomal protein S1 [Planctomycetes bacterium]|nr:30S ribosomal protein S1 [Planctomycetota bacterium]